MSNVYIDIIAHYCYCNRKLNFILSERIGTLKSKYKKIYHETKSNLVN